MESEYALPANAYLEPENPLAVFPQMKKPQILDFRCHKMAGGAQAAIGVFRKLNNPNAKQSKYATIIRTAEDIAREEAGAAAMQDEDQEIVAVKSAVATKEAMDELAALTEKMTLDKKAKIRERKAKGRKSDNVDMNDGDVPKIQIKSKSIKKTQREKNRFKKSRKQLLH